MTFFCRQPSRLSGRLAILLQSQLSARGSVLHVARNFRASSSNAQPTSKLASFNPAPQAYPRRLQIFHAPTLEVTVLGTTKLGGLGLAILACLVVAPNVHLDDASPIWLGPAVAVVSVTVLPILHVLTRPSVTNIWIDIPAWARRSKNSLLSFAKTLPPDTALEIETLGLLPWPRTKAVRLSQLRALPPHLARLSNLEQVTRADAESKVPKSLRWNLERFFARPSESRWKNSRAPEIWPLVMEQIHRNTAAAISGKAVSRHVEGSPLAPSPPPGVVQKRKIASTPAKVARNVHRK